MIIDVTQEMFFGLRGIETPFFYKETEDRVELLMPQETFALRTIVLVPIDPQEYLLWKEETLKDAFRMLGYSDKPKVEVSVSASSD